MVVSSVLQVVKSKVLLEQWSTTEQTVPCEQHSILKQVVVLVAR